MRLPGIAILAAIVFTPVLAAQTRSPLVQAAIEKIQASATGPDLKMALAAAMADDLGVHRNHIFRLRRETGRSYGEIYVSWLESQGHPEDVILQKLGRLDRVLSGSRPEPRLRPVAYLNAAGGRSSSGLFYAVAPEFGLISRHASWVVGLPLYRFFGSSPAGGIGDVYSTASVFGSLRGLDLMPAITIGFPTGDRTRALGAGKTTVDFSVSVAKRIGNVQPFVRMGFANSVFNNVGYQRSYVADGKAAYLTAGLEARPLRRFTVGAAAFAMWPFGSQFLYSRTLPDTAPPSGHMSRSLGTNSPSDGELSERGLSVWTSFRLTPALSINTAAARSISYHVTTIRAGIGLDLLAAYRSMARRLRP